MRRRMMRALQLILGVILLCGTASAAETSSHEWDNETVKMFSLLPIQDGGRVKPLDTYASYTLLQLNGRRSCKNASGENLTPVTWLLDCLFFPEAARQYQSFRVENSEVIIAIGLQPKRKRDNYSYNEIFPARAALMEMGQRLADKESSQQTTVEKELVSLAFNLHLFEQITSYTDFARQQFNITGSKYFRELFPSQESCRLSDILKKSPQVLSIYRDLHKKKDEESAEFEAFTKVIQQLEEVANNTTALALFPPPPASEVDEWMTPADLVEVAFSGAPVMMNQVALLASFETLVASTQDMGAFKQTAKAFTDAITQVARSRSEYAKVPLEVVYNRVSFFYYALILYILSFIVVACMWMRPHNRVLSTGAFIMVSLPTLLLTMGIIIRCIIRARPPVTSMYETIIFVTAVAVVAALFMERVNRQGLAISLGAIMGGAGMFFANKYEVGMGSDTMPTMAAVLNTNFWLAAHVTTIAIGYGAGFLSSGLAHIFVLGRLLRIKRSTPAFYNDLTRMVYGSMCFSFVFICVGTVLGGIWANESWGRFWGWDPKENGALMICLWQLAVLHAKQDGILRGYGINIAVIIGGIIIAFCWFGVNMLSVGLHSYGFSSGGYAALVNFYLVETVVVLLGCAVWFLGRKSEPVVL
jgi:ABC-type transport system involved in cytochrome c biogenesis permease subunit